MKSLGWMLGALLIAATACGGDDDGSTGTDSGTGTRDSGLPPSDSGTPPEDSGTDTDSGTPDEDSGTPAGGDFTLTLMGYTPHVGQQLGIHVEKESDGSTAGMLIDTVDAVDTTKTIAGIIEDGESYTVRWYADLSGNSMCDAPTTDHAWEMTGQVGTATGLAITRGHDSDWTDVCAVF